MGFPLPTLCSLPPPPALLQPQPFRHSRSRPSLVAPPLARLTLTPKGTSLPKHLLETLGVELAGSSARGRRGESQKSLTGKREGEWPHLCLSSPPWQKGDEGPFDPQTLGAWGWRLRTYVRT